VTVRLGSRGLPRERITGPCAIAPAEGPRGRGVACARSQRPGRVGGSRLFETGNGMSVA